MRHYFAVEFNHEDLDLTFVQLYIEPQLSRCSTSVWLYAAFIPEVTHDGLTVRGPLHLDGVPPTRYYLSSGRTHDAIETRMDVDSPRLVPSDGRPRASTCAWKSMNSVRLPFILCASWA